MNINQMIKLENWLRRHKKEIKKEKKERFIPIVVFFSVCNKYVLLLLVNKEASLLCGMAESTQSGRNIQREWAESRRCRIAA